MIRYAIVATQHERSHQPDEFFGALRQRSIIVSPRIQVEEALNPEMSGVQNPLVHLAAERVEFLDAAVTLV
jgi:hypothetical protein